MNPRNRSIILVNVKYYCPLCKFFSYFKYTLRNHLAKDHTDSEGEKYINKLVKRDNLKCSGKVCKIKKIKKKK